MPCERLFMSVLTHLAFTTHPSPDIVLYHSTILVLYSDPPTHSHPHAPNPKMLGHHVTLATDVADATLPDDPIQLEQIVRSRQISLYLPFLVGMWLDAVFLGLILIAFCRWVIYVRPSDSRWTQALVWWLMLPTAVTSAFLVAHNYFLFVTGFADYLRIFNVTCEWSTIQRVVGAGHAG